MANRQHRQVVLVVLLLFALVNTGTCLKCYECSQVDGQHRKCGDPFDKNAVPPQECDQTNICVKYVSPAFGNVPESVNRGCLPKDYCESAKGIAKSCYSCTTELCNSGPSVVPPLTIISLIIVKLCFL